MQTEAMTRGGLLMVEATVSAEVPVAEESLIVPPQDSSAVRAQRFVRGVLTESNVERDVVDLAVLMTKALAINGLLHTQSAIAVTVRVMLESILIEVTDRDSHRVPGGSHSWGMATISR